MKILLITHNPVSTSNNMGKTFSSLFSSFSKSELCQLYIHPSRPNVDICHSYYRITDVEALKSVYTFLAPGGEVIPTSVKDIPRTITSKMKNSALSRLGRDVVWKLSRWYSKGLKLWLDREDPTHIFLAPGYAKFIYDIALKISKDRQIPIITYICDDYYFVKTPSSLIGKLQLTMLKRKMELLMKRTSCLVTICDEIKELYSKVFGVQTVTIMTGADISRIRNVDHTPNSVSYFGNVGCNRYVSLCEVGRALEEINFSKGKTYTLEIYTDEQDPNILKELVSIPTIRLQRFVTGKDFKQAMIGADLLLHTESFDAASMDLVKHSVSTKIADSLASGIPLVAYGPAEIASIKHLRRHDCAFIATTAEALNMILSKALTISKERCRVVENALCTAPKYHDREKNSAFLRSVFAEIGKENA